MKMRRLMLFITAMLLAVLACNLPGNTPVEVGNQPESVPDPEADQPQPEEEAPAPPDPTDTPVPRPTLPPLVTFLGIQDGDTVTAEVDPASGLPFVSFEIEPRVANNRELPVVALDADGLHVYSLQVYYQESGDTRAVSWTPWHGNGEYVLDLWMFDKKGKTVHQETIKVTVAGIPEELPTIQARFMQAYEEYFGLRVPAPPFAFFSSTDEFFKLDADQWISAIYLSDNLHVVRLFANGEQKAYSRQIKTLDGGKALCSPSGTFKILTLVVDYSNTDIDPTIVKENIDSVVDQTNQDWTDFSASQGIDKPIIKILNTTAYVPAPPTPGNFLTLEEIKSLTGLDPLGYNLIGEIDLDAEGRAISKYVKAGGLAFPSTCYPGGPVEAIDMTMKVSRKAKPNSAVLYQHEFIHLFGWEHEWPIGDGGSLSLYSLGSKDYPYLLFGWTDTDGDGVVEILDETPYGMEP